MAPQKNWDRKNARTASTRLRTEDYQKLRDICAAQGTTVYEVLLAYCRALLAAGRPIVTGR